MTDLATRTVAPIVTATTKRLGAELPPALAKRLDEANRLRTERRSLEAANITKHVADAILGGKDPLASKDVQRAALAQTLLDANITNRLDAYAHELAAAAVLDFADAIIDTWRPAVEQADSALKRYREHVPGGNPLEDGLPTGLPTKALTPWGEAREAAANLEQLSKGWQALASVGAVYMGEGTSRLLIVADLTAEQVASLGGNRCTDVLRLDVPLELASVATFTERVQRVAQGRAEAHAYETAAPDRARAERRERAAKEMQRVGMVKIP